MASLMDRVRAIIGLSPHEQKAEVQRRLTAQMLRLRRVDADIDAQRAASAPPRRIVSVYGAAPPNHPRRRSTDA